MNSSERQVESVDEVVQRLGKFDGGWVFVVGSQIVLAIIALTVDRDSPTSGKAQGALLMISALAVLYSLLLVPGIGLAKVFHAAPIVSLTLGVVSLAFIMDFSLFAKHGMAIGVVSVLAGLFALRNIVAVWRTRLRR